jgi:hypothetical protein
MSGETVLALVAAVLALLLVLWVRARSRRNPGEAPLAPPEPSPAQPFHAPNRVNWHAVTEKTPDGHRLLLTNHGPGDAYLVDIRLDGDPYPFPEAGTGGVIDKLAAGSSVTATFTGAQGALRPERLDIRYLDEGGEEALFHTFL